MPTFRGGSGTNAYNIGKCLDLNNNATSCLQRTFGTPTAAGLDKYTYSVWAKRTGANAYKTLLGTGYNLGFLSWIEGKIDMSLSAGGRNVSMLSSATYTSTSVWYHFVYVWDRSATTLRLYVDGTLITSFNFAPTYPLVGSVSDINSAASHVIGATDLVGSFHHDGKIARPCFIEGQALAASDFGQTSGSLWVSKSQSQLKALADSGDGNSFFLDFDNGASVTTLGYDKSSHGNNWTLNSLTTSDWVSA